MITIKNASQIEKMRKAGAVLYAVLTQLREHVKPGVTTGELNRVADRLIRASGGVPSFLHYDGYPASICTSVDEQVVHGIPSDKIVLREGQIVSIDCGVKLDGWQSDSALTVGVGKVSDQARRLMEVTEGCFYAGLEFAREGCRISDIGNAVQVYAESRGCGVVRTYTGHGIGREMHEEPAIPFYGPPGHGVRLRRGMTICIEPMITAGGYDTRILRDGWTAVTKDKSLASHYEHTVLITDGEPELLSYPGYRKGEGA